jgi:hypothetical protein
MSSNSSRIQPAARPSDTRPLDSTDAVATCFATCRIGRAGAM